MTTEYEYTDPDGDMLHIVGDGDWVRLDIADAGSSATVMTAAVLIAASDVRKVTAAMYEKAGLPDRWAEMRGWLDAKISSLLAEAQTETVLMARNLRRDARLLTTVRDQMDAAESPVPAPREDQ